ncbi:hypothetical protein PCASD_16163 [Puccinia coronata f. sp. avenae]|uniref:Uncharacterized protein n=1 Tax=Puccinia coronata f. sp. avenae TaxID=200324 RepID=A0A2N5UBE1_9BASI|nr:hypothetical protein PCASD_16163 [Puccinia coronata f. sp. avenae]
MSLRMCTCNSCKARFNGKGPLVTQQTITRHLLKQQQLMVVPSTRKLLEHFQDTKTPVMNEEAELTETRPSGSSHANEWLHLSLVLAAHLHVVCGLSRADSNTALATLKSILQSFNNKQTTNALATFPVDVRTAIDWLKIEPSIHRTLCCPGCFKIFDPSWKSRLCNHRETPCSRECNAELFDHQNKPLRQYSTQSFQEWIIKFVQRDGIEDLLQHSINPLNSSNNPSFRGSIWDGAIWSSFKDSDGQPFHQRFGNLSFGIYVDWFNPQGNKTSGKHKSIGVIILFCLSIPASHRYKLQNLFFAGITPGPSEPTVLQMNNVLFPLVDELKKLWLPGLRIPTRTYPDGLLVKVALIAAVCDLPAIRKLIGYASHSAEMFCSFCYLPQSRNQDLNYATWRLRTLEGHKSESEAWKSATTHAQREDTFKACGVWWSVLNELSYWDPTSFTVVEPMHLLSGILSWHAMRVWCLKEIALELKDKRPIDYGQPLTEDYFNEDDYEQLREDKRYSPPDSISGINLHLSKIRWVIKHTEIPPWLNRPSPIFGDASAGKVRSADWISFFTIFMPFAIVELDRTNQHEIVNSWYHLAMLTEIAMDYTNDQNKTQRYLFHLTSY